VLRKKNKNYHECLKVQEFVFNKDTNDCYLCLKSASIMKDRLIGFFSFNVSEV